MKAVDTVLIQFGHNDGSPVNEEASVPPDKRRSRGSLPGLVEADGTLRDLSRVVKDITPAVLAPAMLRKLRAVKAARLPIVRGRPRLGCPLAGIGKMVCIGLNYTDHAEEVGMALPKEPTVFIKAPSAVCGPDDATIRPRGGTKLDYECELALVIGKGGRGITRANALDHVWGYTIVNDVTARDLQRAEKQWGRAKGFDTFCPLGPWIETELNPSDLAITCTVDGELRQAGRTTQMTRSVADLVSYVSEAMTLLPGDVILTGTPAGVGPIVVGQQVSVGIEGIGNLTNRVVARD